MPKLEEQQLSDFAVFVLFTHSLVATEFSVNGFCLRPSSLLGMLVRPVRKCASRYKSACESQQTQPRGRAQNPLQGRAENQPQGRAQSPQPRSAKSQSPLVGFAVGDVVFSEFELESVTRHGQLVWYKGVIHALPNMDKRNRKHYTVVFEDKDDQKSLEAKDLFLHLPNSGVAYDGGRYSRIVKGKIVRGDSDDVSDLSEMEQPIAPEQPALSYAPLAPDLPSVHQIFAKITPVMRHIPYACRGAFASALMALLNDCKFFNDAYAWCSYFLFVPVVLCPMKRGGLSRKNALVSYLRGRIVRWLGRSDVDLRSRTLDRVAMWEEIQPVVPRENVHDPIKRCKFLAAEGRYGLACCALADVESVAPFSQVTFDLLALKHPKGSVVPNFPHLPSQQINLDAIKSAIASFPVGSGAGPSRLSPDHLKEALGSNVGALVHEKICDFVNFLVQGRASRLVQPFLVGATLTPLLKKDGGIRPIACGDVFRRVAAKSLMHSVRDQARFFFSPNQFGVATRSGAEIIIHSWREAISAPAFRDLVALKVDLRNAFNLVDRSAMLSFIHSSFPSLFSFAYFCYSLPSHLFVRGSEESIASAQGVQQGDPLGPLFACLVFHEVVKKINQLDGVRLNLWYMDDGGIIAPTDTIARVLEIFEQEKGRLGVHLNAAKTEIIWLSGHPPALDPFAAFAFKITSPDAMEMLGAPLGRPAHCEAFVLEKAVTRNEAMLEKLHSLNDPQVAFLLLRSCLSFCKMIYFMRCVPLDSMVNAAARFDALILSCLSKLINFKITPDAYTQLSLNVSNGGLGLRKVSDHHPAAFLASIRACLPIVRELTGLVGVRSAGAMARAEALLQPYALDLSKLHTQADISAAMDGFVLNRLLQASSEVNCARLLSSASPHAGDFLFAPPIPGLGLKLLPVEWSLAVAYKLGLELLPEASVCSSNGCHAIMDPQALHAPRCGCQGDRIRRHNLLRNFFFKECERALMEPVLEPPNLVRNSGEKPADWGIPDLRPGVFQAYDVAVTDPTQSALLPASSVTRAAAAESYAEAKFRKYSVALQDGSLRLTPVVLETFGAFSKSAAEFVSDLARWIAARDPSSSASLVRSRLFQRVSVILQRANARMIASRILGFQ